MLLSNCKICGKRKSQFTSDKKGGFIFTVPAMLAAAGALGSLAGGAAGIANAVNKKKNSDKLLNETIRHNKTMEGKGLIKNQRGGGGKGLFLKPFNNKKTGHGLFIKPYEGKGLTKKKINKEKEK
jgi:hypothetical protein